MMPPSSPGGLNLSFLTFIPPQFTDRQDDASQEVPLAPFFPSSSEPTPKLRALVPRLDTGIAAKHHVGGRESLL